MKIVKTLILIFTIFTSDFVLADVYNVGPAQDYTTIGSVPWYSLQAGDTVYIHAKPDSAPYYEKFMISGVGTSSAWIRVLGVPDGDGNLPIISGNNAVTSPNNHLRSSWQVPNSNQIESNGVVQINLRDDSTQYPSYIEIANLKIQDGHATNTFTSENGTSGIAYSNMCAAIYIWMAQNILIKNCIFNNNGEGIFTKTASSRTTPYASFQWWDGVCKNITISGCTFYDNGVSGIFNEHQVYTEAENIIFEYNYFGVPKSGMLGSQLKDRSAGTIIRYNHFETSPKGWTMDLVEPEDAWPYLGSLDIYKQTFVYGNEINYNNGYSNVIHWNGDDFAATEGRATVTGSKLLFYNNTVSLVGDSTAVWNGLAQFFKNVGGSQDCLTAETLPGVIDVRNNLFVSIPTTQGHTPLYIDFGCKCPNYNITFGINWATTGWTLTGGNSTPFLGTAIGTDNTISGTVYPLVSSTDYHLASGSQAAGAAGALPPEATSNYLGLDLTPLSDYEQNLRNTIDDIGAYEYAPGTAYDSPTITGPADSSTTNTSVEIEGTYTVDSDLADQSVVVTWILGESSGFAVAALGVFSCTVPVELGSNSIVFRVVDSNSVEDEDTTVVTRTAPGTSSGVTIQGIQWNQ